MLVAATACAGSDASPPSTLNTGPPSASSILTEAREDVRDGAVGDPVALDLEVRSDQLQTYTFAALGGIRLAADESHGVYSIGDRVIVDPIGSGTGSFRVGVAYLGLTTQATDGTPIPTVEGFLDQLDSVEGLAIEPNGRSVELFDHQLVGYSISRDQPAAASASGGVEDWAFTLFASTRIGAPTLHAWAPQRDEIFLADTAAGVLYAGYGTGGEQSESVARPAFDTLVSTAALTGPGLDVALPAGSTPSATDVPPAPATVVDGGPEPLRAASGEVRPGVYQLPNFGQSISVELTGWWIDENRPGAVVLTGRDSAGPGERDVVFLTGLSRTLAPQAGGPRVGGDPVDLVDITSFLDTPPFVLDVSAVEDTTVGGLQATRFDVEVSDGATCAQHEPCEFVFETAWDRTVSASIRAEARHRIWWIPEHPTGTAMILAVDRNPEFLDRVTELVESVEPLR